MTKIAKPIQRETDSLCRGSRGARRTLVLEMRSKYLCLWPKSGRRRSHAVSLSYEAIYDLGWKIASREAAAQRLRIRGGN